MGGLDGVVSLFAGPLWLFVTPTKRRAVCAQSHLRITAAQAILKNLGWRFCSMAKLIFGLSQSLDGYIDHLEMRPGPALIRHFVEHVRVEDVRLRSRLYSATSSAGLPKRRAVDTYPCGRVVAGPVLAMRVFGQIYSIHFERGPPCQKKRSRRRNRKPN
jgi:hypothetical protein